MVAIEKMILLADLIHHCLRLRHTNDSRIGCVIEVSDDLSDDDLSEGEK